MRQLHPIRIKVDEDLPARVAWLLREHGYQATTVTEQGMGGWKDPRLFEAVQAERRYLITADKGFGDIRIYPPGSHWGLLLLRPDEDGIGPVIELIEEVLARISDLSELEGMLAVASPGKLRIRRPEA